MKKLVFLIALIAVAILLASKFMLNGGSLNPQPSPAYLETVIPNPSPEVPTILFCQKQLLQAKLSLDPGAGNIYGTLTLKNTDAVPCRILAKEFIKPTFSAKNITVSNQGTPSSDDIILQPSQTVYSQIHYPNGPQCSGQPNSVPVTFTYQVSTSSAVVFTDDSKKAQQLVPSCSSSQEETEIQVWPMLFQPIQ